MEEKLMLKNKSTHAVITFVTMFAVQGALAATTTPTPKHVVAGSTRPLSFEPNQGQADKRVDFLAHGTGYGLFLSHADAVMKFEHGAAVRMRPVGANASASAESLEQQPSKSNYFIGNVPERWHTNLPNYAKVRYRSIYPGVDLIYYGNQRQLEYDFVVGPGANPADILLDFEGASKAGLDRSGDLVMHTAVGDLHWHKPVAYQEVNGDRRLIACTYTRKTSNHLGFKLTAYDRTKPLIIDPVLEYSTYLGGSGGEYLGSSPSGGIAVERKVRVAARTEMYLQGVSTRKVKAITEELCGYEFSSTISQIAQFEADFGARKAVFGVPNHSELESIAFTLAVDIQLERRRGC
jgi:hypothetical protein